MAKRKHEILTDAEREQLIGIPTGRDRLARLYTIEPADVDLIGTRREQRNLLGVAVQLALLRHPGMTLAQWTAEMVKMQRAYGAPLDEAEIKLLGIYLTSAYGDAAAAGRRLSP